MLPIAERYLAGAGEFEHAARMLDGTYGALPEKVVGVSDRVYRNGKHLLALVNDILDLSKIEAGQLSLSLDEYAMPSVVQSVIAATESLAQAKAVMPRVSMDRRTSRSKFPSRQTMPRISSANSRAVTAITALSAWLRRRLLKAMC